MIARIRHALERRLAESLLRSELASAPDPDRIAPVSSAPESVFVLRNNDLGDVLAVTPLLAAIRRHRPSTRIEVGVGPWASPLLEGHPDVDRVHVVAAPWFNKFTQTGARSARRFVRCSGVAEALRARRFDVGIDPLGSAWGAALLVRAGIPVRLGTLGYAGGERGFRDGVRFDPDESVARRCQRFAALLGARDLPDPLPSMTLTRVEAEAAEGVWRELAKGHPAPRRVVVAPGSGLPAKAWPIDRFRRVVERLAERTDLVVAVVAGPAEVDLAARVAADRATSLAGRLGLRPTCALLARSDLVLANSSFAFHAAVAVGRPAIAVLGPAFGSARRHQRQWGYEGWTTTLGPEPDEGRGLATPEEVLRAVEERLVAAPAGAR